MWPIRKYNAIDDMNLLTAILFARSIGPRIQPPGLWTARQGRHLFVPTRWVGYRVSDAENDRMRVDGDRSNRTVAGPAPDVHSGFGRRGDPLHTAHVGAHRLGDQNRAVRLLA